MKPFGNLAYPSMEGSLKAKNIISDADEGGLLEKWRKVGAGENYCTCKNLHSRITRTN